MKSINRSAPRGDARKNGNFKTNVTNSDTIGVIEVSRHTIHASSVGSYRDSFEEWKRKGCKIEAEDLENLQGARAHELLQLNHVGRAYRVLRCSTFECRDRLCPKCAQTRSREHRNLVSKTVQKMTKPVLSVFKVYSSSFSALALSRAYGRLRRGISNLRRLKSFRDIRVGIGRIEAVPVLLGGKRVWHVHAHMLLDAAATALDAREVRKDFRNCTKVRNSDFDFEDIRSELAVIRYITKARDVCPAPGVLDLQALSDLAFASRGREVLIRWGLSGRGKRRKPRTRAMNALVGDLSERAVRDDFYGDLFVPDEAKSVYDKECRAPRAEREKRWRIRVKRRKDGRNGNGQRVSVTSP